MNILMVTIGYPPHDVGGTEVYVSGLVEALKRRGHQCDVAYIEPFEEVDGPEIAITTSQSEGTTVYVIRVNTAHHKLEFLVFDPVLRGKLLDVYRRLVADLRPDVVHVHPLQLGFESYLIEMLRRAGNRVVLTYHSTTTTCARGDLIYMGREVCDSLLRRERCTRCYYHWKALPEPVAGLLSKAPLNWYHTVFEGAKPHPTLHKLSSFASIPILIEERFKAWTRATANADAVVAVCEWVKETTVKNGVPEEKVILSRHGLRIVPDQPMVRERGIPRFGYLGRISPEKGIDSLLDALKMIPLPVNFEFEFCSSSFEKSNRGPEEEGLVQAVYRLQAQDRRVRVLTGIEDDKLASILAQWDAMVVPSLWLESGPQVIYEAFAVQTPIIGSRRGGIAELVIEGKTGLLFSPGEALELADLLQRCATNPTEIRALRDNVPPVRTTAEVADDMLMVYQHITARAATH